jgi:hypothetical protein
MASSGIQSRSADTEIATPTAKMINTSEPITFLTLPRELRQKIIFESSYERMQKYLSSPDKDNISFPYIERWRLHKTMNEWTSIMEQVDDSVLADVEYMKNKWTKRVEYNSSAYYATAHAKWVELLKKAKY